MTNSSNSSCKGCVEGLSSFIPEQWKCCLNRSNHSTHGMTISIKYFNYSYPASIGFPKPQDIENTHTRRWEQFLFHPQQSEYLRVKISGKTPQTGKPFPSRWVKGNQCHKWLVIQKCWLSAAEVLRRQRQLSQEVVLSLTHLSPGKQILITLRKQLELFHVVFSKKKKPRRRMPLSEKRPIFTQWRAWHLYCPYQKSLIYFKFFLSTFSISKEPPFEVSSVIKKGPS